VGANKTLREKLNKTGNKLGINLFFPRIEFCTDNGAMIAYAGHQRLKIGQKQTHTSVDVFPKWSLETL
jgi:N6-L-threonylcarbamoyladenine synthase